MLTAKPDKPYPNFPLFAHPNGSWAKTIKGKHHYFGPWSDHQAALKEFKRVEDDLRAGRTPSTGDGLSIKQLVNKFLTSKKRLVESGELEERSFNDYYKNCERVLKVFGKNTHVKNLRPSDFEKLRANFATTHGPKTLEGDITRTRVLFNYCDDTFDIRVKYGQSFNKPTKTVLRKHRNEQPSKMFQPSELRDLIKKASVQLRAMIYLGVNCGFGANDCAMLPLSHVDFTGKWINFPRPKTGIHRRCPLWPETVKALNEAIEQRPTPKKPTNRLFITKYGNTWEPKTLRDSPIGKEFTKLLKLKELDLHQPGLGFYTLRHVFQTVGDRARDKDAVRAIQGHAERANDMGAVYNQEPVEDARLIAVTDHVRRWLMGRTR